MDASAQPTPAGSRLALYVLLALVVLSPWPFGSVHLRTTQAIAVVSLFAALAAFLWDGWRDRLQLPAGPLLWLLLGLWALAVFQLVPLPTALHQWLAPGSAFIWHPSEPAAAAVLGPGPHPVSIYPEATRRWLAFATGIAALTLAAAPALRDRKILFQSAAVIVAGGLAVAVYGLAARVVFGSKLFGVFEVPTVAPFGPFVSKNHFAGYVEMAAILAIGLATGLTDQVRRQPGWLSWISGRGAPAIVVAWGAAGVLVLTVPVSLSRGGVLSLVVGFGFFAVIRVGTGSHREFSTRRMALAGTALGLAGLFVVATLLPTARDRVLTLTGVVNEQSGSYRLDVWRDTLRMAAKSPLVGYGFGAYEDSLPRFKTARGHLRVQHAENDYLELLAEGGGLGAGLGVASALLILGLGIRGTRDRHHRLLGAIQVAALAASTALLVHGFFDFNMRIPSNLLLFSALVALLLSPSPEDVHLRHLKVRERRRLLPIAVLVVAVVCGVTTPWRSRGYDPITLTASRNGSLRRVGLEANITATLRLRPAAAAGWVTLGWLRISTSPSEAVALARWGAGLDPGHERLREVSDRFQEPR